MPLVCLWGITLIEVGSSTVLVSFCHKLKSFGESEPYLRRDLYQIGVCFNLMIDVRGSSILCVVSPLCKGIAKYIISVCLSMIYNVVDTVTSAYQGVQEILLMKLVT